MQTLVDLGPGPAVPHPGIGKVAVLRNLSEETADIRLRAPPAWLLAWVFSWRFWVAPGVRSLPWGAGQASAFPELCPSSLVAALLGPGWGRQCETHTRPGGPKQPAMSSWPQLPGVANALPLSGEFRARRLY